MTHSFSFAACLACALVNMATAQEQKPRDPLDVPLAPLIKTLLEDDTLSQAERRRVALFHGQWDKLTEPTLAERAAMALAKYELNDASLRDPAAPSLLRAEAALLRGEPQSTIAILEKETSAQAALLRAQAFDDMGKAAEAIDALKPWREKLQKQQVADAAEMVAAARGLALLAQLEGRPSRDYEMAMQLFSKARTDLDRLHWPASLAEAQLLMDKDNPQDAIDAVLDVLRLNPRCAEAAYVLGSFAAAQFNFTDASKIIEKLRAINPDHLLASLIDAESHLTQKDHEGARAAVEPALALYPNHRQLLAYLAAVEALSYNETQLQRVLTHYDKVTGGNPTALMTAGAYLSHARQYAASEKLLRLAVERRPNWPQPRVELGLMLMQAGKEQEALVELRQSAALDPFNRRARNQLKLVEELLGYEHIATEHFVIKYRKGIDEVLARDMERQIEDIYDYVTGAYQHKPARKTLIEIMPDEQWFGVRITGLPEIWTIAACTGDVIAMTPPREGKGQRGPYDWKRVLQHEYTHTVTLDQTAYRIAHWFTEAAAVAMEPGGREYQMNQLLADAVNDDRLFSLTTINWGFIRPRTPTDRPLAYAQAHWMLEYITERFGHKAVLAILAKQREGIPEVKCITDVTRQSADEFMQGFRRWAGEQVKQWGMAKREDDAKVIERLKSAVVVTDPFVASLVKDFPDHPEVLLLAAKRAVEVNGVDSRAAVLRYAAARPADPWSHEALYTLAAKSGHIDEAIGSLSELDRVEVSSGRWARLLAELYRRQGDFAQAGRAITRALHREPYDPALRELAAAIMIQAKDMAAAAHHVRALTLLEPDRAVHHIRLAAIYELMGDKAKAKAAALAAKKIDPRAAVERFLGDE